MEKKKEKEPDPDYERPIDPTKNEGLTEEADWNFGDEVDKLANSFEKSNPGFHGLMKKHANKKPARKD